MAKANEDQTETLNNFIKRYTEENPEWVYTDLEAQAKRFLAKKQTRAELKALDDEYESQKVYLQGKLDRL